MRPERLFLLINAISSRLNAVDLIHLGKLLYYQFNFIIFIIITEAMKAASETAMKSFGASTPGNPFLH